MLCSVCPALLRDLRECARGMQNKSWWINDSSVCACACATVLCELCCVVLCCAVLCYVPVACHSPTTHSSLRLASHNSLLASPLASPLLSSRLTAPLTDLDSPIIQFALAGTPRPVSACFWPAWACAPGPAPHRTAPPFTQPNFDTTTRPPPPPPLLTHSLTPHSLTHNQRRAVRTSCKSCICLSNSTAALAAANSTLLARRSAHTSLAVHNPRSVPSLRPLENQHPPSPPRSTQNTATSSPRPPYSTSDTNPP
jgi:hypothetical protein